MICRLVLFGFMLLGAGIAQAETVDYDPEKQLLSVNADRVPLSEVLRQVSQQTGITVRIDPSINNVVSYTIPPTPLERVLAHITKDLSHVINFERTDTVRRIVSIDVLPQGRYDSANLIPVELAGSPQSGNADDIVNYVIEQNNEMHNTIETPYKASPPDTKSTDTLMQ